MQMSVMAQLCHGSCHVAIATATATFPQYKQINQQSFVADISVTS